LPKEHGVKYPVADGRSFYQHGFPKSTLEEPSDADVEVDPEVESITMVVVVVGTLKDVESE